MLRLTVMLLYSGGRQGTPTAQASLPIYHQPSPKCTAVNVFGNVITKTLGRQKKNNNNSAGKLDNYFNNNVFCLAHSFGFRSEIRVRLVGDNTYSASGGGGKRRKCENIIYLLSYRNAIRKCWARYTSAAVLISKLKIFPQPINMNSAHVRRAALHPQSSSPARNIPIISVTRRSGRRHGYLPLNVSIRFFPLRS